MGGRKLQEWPRDSRPSPYMADRGTVRGLREDSRSGRGARRGRRRREIRSPPPAGPWSRVAVWSSRGSWLSILFFPAPELNFRIFEIFMAASQKATLVFHQTQPKGKRDGNQIPCKRRSKILPYLCCLSLLTLPGH
jgi:hypothetical protein